MSLLTINFHDRLNVTVFAIDSSLNDGLALPAVLAFAAALDPHTHHFVWWRFLLQDIGLGLAFGLVCGAMTALGGVGHTLPFLIQDFRYAMAVAIAVVLVELGTITWIRHRYMDTPIPSAALQVGLGGALVFVTGILIGSS